ncbi:hypothetical protein QS306_03905 [Paraburkholderia bonniea]|uniref:hypothetical protein n=1 Tax=Paraburkholderia bonniea TaxID=2152891 RepID=UPI0025738C4A|nr:hypothetical protein [Paraburkholderia bonniea]WJF90820.1 hypothetical protein QS306_03905 [Paraburkholderia bonniea]WJF94134.1 hypothetical protein QS308_03905 [Paraburkholderia bonniea]
MPIIKLEHLKALGYAAISRKTAPLLPDEVIQQADNGAVVVTFRPLGKRDPERTVKKIHAAERFSWITGTHVIAYGLETDSPLAPLILWDIAHALKEGGLISVYNDAISESYLLRDYFRLGLEIVEQSASGIVFRKFAPLAAERDSGLDSWTFGIPVGPEDATLLNAVVKRILELDIEHKEILLCGRPGDNFAYLDQVRIVGEDITAPPVQICAKKNRLALEAKHPNLCIIHDRVFLPSDFGDVVRRFGDCYPLTTLQSVFFDDRYNLVPRRYSDYGISHRVRGQNERGVMRNEGVESLSAFSPGILALTESAGFYGANALRYGMSNYPTGSMYICKKSVWLLSPQNENLHWIEFEDLEHAFRASDYGIPSRVNPYGITQSLISRPLLSRATGSFIESARGRAKLVRSWTEVLPINRKPAIKVPADKALEMMHRFAKKYIPREIQIGVPVAAVERSAQRLLTTIDILSRVRVPVQKKALREFIQDFGKQIVFDQFPFSWIEYTLHRFIVDRVHPVKAMVDENEILLSHVVLRPKGQIFYRSPDDYFQKRSLKVWLGTWCSALHLYRRRRDVLYLQGGLLFYFRALFRTTPFRKP